MNLEVSSSSPERPDPDRRKRAEARARATLWSAVWECSRIFMDDDEIHLIVADTLREIERDNP